MLAYRQVDALNERGIDVPAAGRSDVLDRLQGAEHHAVPYPHQAPPPHGLDHLCIEELGPGHPAGLRHGTRGPAAWWLDPVAKVCQERSRILLEAVSHKQRHTAWRQDLGDLMHHALCHRTGALPDLDGQE